MHLWQHKGIGVKLVLQIYYIFVMYHIKYDRSFERFQYYEYESVSKNPKVIEKLKKQYPVLQSYLDFYENNLKESSKIIRINSFGQDETVWYIAAIDPTVFLISVREII